MSVQPKDKMQRKLGYFEDSGTDKKKLSLLRMAYFNATEKAKDIIKTDPDQINYQDPHAGLTTLHIAIFRQNVELVEILANHPRTKMELKDNFGRRSVDMLDYTINQKIFDAVMKAAYPEQIRTLETRDNEGGNVTDFKPKPE